MSRDGGYCNCCGKHHIFTGIDYSTGKDVSSLLVINLQDETSVPKVFYKGEEITNKVNVFFDWDTDTDVYGGLSYAIEHLETGGKYPVNNRIERRTKGHAFE